MRNFIYFLLFLCVVTDSVYARKVKRFDLLRDAVFKMVKIPEFTGKMIWERGGVAIDEFVRYLDTHEPKISNLYTDNGLRSVLGKALYEKMGGDIFSLQIDTDGKVVRKYFVGEEPDLKAMIAEVIAIPELRAKMKWGNEGLSMDEIMAEVIKLRPDVHTLYVQAAHNKTDHGLRIALGLILDEEMGGEVFSLHIGVDGKTVRKYFLGEEADLKAIISEVIAIPALSAKMELGSDGLSMDEIIAGVIELHPDVYTLYVQAAHNKTDQGLRSTLGKVLDEEMRGEVFSWQSSVGDKTVKKYFRGTEPELKAIVAEVIAIPEFRVKMEWGSDGLSMGEIMAEVIRIHPDIHTLYEQTSHNETDHGLYSQLGKALYKTMGGEVFSLHIDEDGKTVKKYFRGKEPDLKAIISKVIAIPELSTKMEWENGGLSMDEIMAEIIKLHPDVHALYVRASDSKTDHGLRSTLGRILDKKMEDDIFGWQIDIDGKTVKKYFRGKEADLKAIISKVIAVPELRAKMEWENGGLSMGEIMAEVIKLRPDVYALYVRALDSKTDHGLRLVLGKLLDKGIGDEVFNLHIDVDGKSVRKYFRSKEPDLKAIISKVIAIPELRAKMEWENGGLSMDEIIAGIIELHPDVYTLYVQAAHNKTDNGLRSQLGKELYEKIGSEVFDLPIGVDGKSVRKYFRGKEPDLKAIIAKVIAIPKLRSKMERGNAGLSMDEIMAEVIKLRPDVHALYVQASDSKTDHGLRSALGKLLDEKMRGEVFSLRIYVDGKSVRKYFRGAEPELKAIIAEVIAIPALRAKMEWGNEGLSMDEIMAEVIKLYPDVYALYVQAAHNETDHGLRSVLGKALDEEMGGDIFSLQIDTDGKIVRKYFLGKELILKP